MVLGPFGSVTVGGNYSTSPLMFVMDGTFCDDVFGIALQGYVKRSWLLPSYEVELRGSFGSLGQARVRMIT